MIDEHVPDVSVIVVVHNDESHLAQAVQSVLTQPLDSLEVIISDDHSTDATPEVARGLANADDRVTYLRRSENSGAPGAPLNDGLARARGRFVMFLDSDDVLTPEALPTLLRSAQSTGAEIVSGQLVRVLHAEEHARRPWMPELHRTERYVGSLEEFPEQLRDTLKTNKLYRKSFLDRIHARYPEGIFYEDVVFSADTLAQATGIALIPDEVYEWHVYPRDERESITNQRHSAKNLEDRLRALDLAETRFSTSSAEVQLEFHKKVLNHHVRFYLNDFLDADDAWCAWVLDTVRPRLEATPIEAYRSGYLGDRALYASAIEGDIDAVRDVLRGKTGGALAGHIFSDGDVTFWAPRDPESRPDTHELARQLSDITDSAGRIKSHADFTYLHSLTSVDDTHAMTLLRGTSTDPRSILAHPAAELRLLTSTPSRSVDLATEIRVTATPSGIAWETRVPRIVEVAARRGEVATLRIAATAPDGTVNESPVRFEVRAGDEVAAPEHSSSSSPAAWRFGSDFDGWATARPSDTEQASPPRVIVIGDISWLGRYHLGDEAMTESAVEQLRARGSEVTLIAGDPEISGALYDVAAVPVFGFARCANDREREARADEVLAGVHDPARLHDSDARTVAAILAADAVVIAGGGNLNSSGVHHIYERLVLTRIAAHAGIPLFVTSQTVGPHLLPEHRALVKEIATYAQVFGARERATAALMRELCGESATVVQCLDDALLLSPRDTAQSERTIAATTERYVVGSFTYHAFSTGLSREEYYRELGGMLDDIVATHDVDILLLPHMGVLGPDHHSGEDNDQYGHDRIAAYATSKRVRSLPLMSAREVFAITARARFTISTRYHPVVFGAALGVPAIGIVTSYYSALRMRGALAHFGMESFAIPFEHWRLLGPRLLAALAERREDFAAQSRRAGKAQREHQEKWWDAIASRIAGGGDVLRADTEAVMPCEWTDARNAELLAVAQVAQEGTNMYRMNNLFTVNRHAAQLSELLRDARRALEEAAELRRELAEFRHRMRPPGAALRDRIRSSLSAARRRTGR